MATFQTWTKNNPAFVQSGPFAPRLNSTGQISAFTNPSAFRQTPAVGLNQGMNTSQAYSALLGQLTGQQPQAQTGFGNMASLGGIYGQNRMMGQPNAMQYYNPMMTPYAAGTSQSWWNQGQNRQPANIPNSFVGSAGRTQSLNPNQAAAYISARQQYGNAANLLPGGRTITPQTPQQRAEVAQVGYNPVTGFPNPSSVIGGHLFPGAMNTPALPSGESILTENPALRNFDPSSPIKSKYLLTREEDYQNPLMLAYSQLSAQERTSKKFQGSVNRTLQWLKSWKKQPENYGVDIRSPSGIRQWLTAYNNQEGLTEAGKIGNAAAGGVLAILRSNPQL